MTCFIPWKYGISDWSLRNNNIYLRGVRKSYWFRTPSLEAWRSTAPPSCSIVKWGVQHCSTEVFLGLSRAAHYRPIALFTSLKCSPHSVKPPPKDHVSHSSPLYHSCTASTRNARNKLGAHAAGCFYSWSACMCVCVCAHASMSEASCPPSFFFVGWDCCWMCHLPDWDTAKR